MTTRCRYCFRVVADEAAHVRAEHELHLTRNRARVEPQTFQPRSMCPTCFRLTSNVHVHHENVHVTSVSIYIRPDREVFHRAANGMFNCPCCAARFLNPVRFRVSALAT